MDPFKMYLLWTMVFFYCHLRFLEGTVIFILNLNGQPTTTVCPHLPSMQLPAWQRAESVSKQHATGRKHDERDLKQGSWWEIPHNWAIAPYTSGQIVLYFLNLNYLGIFEGFRCKELSNGGHDERPTQTSCTMRRKIPEKLPAICICIYIYHVLQI